MIVNMVFIDPCAVVAFKLKTKPKREPLHLYFSLDGI